MDSNESGGSPEGHQVDGNKRVSSTEINKENPQAKRPKLEVSEHLYKTLFEMGHLSDITVRAMGKDWKLHKEIIKQSPYFASMFSGTWRETGNKVVNLKITDQKITKNSLFVTFGSLYIDEIDFESKDLVAVLASASFFQLQKLIDKCTNLMMEGVDFTTAVNYYNAAERYGIGDVKATAFEWLEANLQEKKFHEPNVLQNVSLELMTSIVTSKDFIPPNCAFNHYSLLSTWLFAILRNNKQITREEFFQGQKWITPFLSSKAGNEYTALFRTLSLRAIFLELDHEIYIKTFRQEKIIPEDWIVDAFKTNWRFMQLIFRNDDKGPKEVNEEVFERECYRFSKSWQNESDPLHSRWYRTAFLFGVKLEFTLNKKTFVVRRFHKYGEACISLHEDRTIGIKVGLKWLNEKGNVRKVESSELQFLSLKVNETKAVMNFKEEMSYPVTIVVKVLVHDTSK